MRWNETSHLAIDVQFEDIDGGGVVHHPNYLKYLERARCQSMREIGVPFDECLKDGIAFVVAEVNSRYLRPLLLGQKVHVLTRLVAARKSSLKVFQKILPQPPSAEEIALGHELYFTRGSPCYIAQLRLVAVDLKSGKPIPLPEKLRIASGCPTQEELLKVGSWSDVRLSTFASDVS